MEEELTNDRARRPPRLAELPVDRSPLRHGRPAEKLSPPPLQKPPGRRPPPGCAPRRAIQKGAGWHTSKRRVRLVRRWARGSGNEPVRRPERRERGKGRRGQHRSSRGEEAVCRFLAPSSLVSPARSRRRGERRGRVIKKSREKEVFFYRALATFSVGRRSVCRHADGDGTETPSVRRWGFLHVLPACLWSGACSTTWLFAIV
jgi:hypothetical protein